MHSQTSLPLQSVAVEALVANSGTLRATLSGLVSFSGVRSPLAALGDLDGDGYGDLAVGSWGGSAAASQGGAVFVLMGGPGL